MYRHKREGVYNLDSNFDWNQLSNYIFLVWTTYAGNLDRIYIKLLVRYTIFVILRTIEFIHGIVKDS